MVTRKIPSKVLDILREEVGFHCPIDVDGDVCGSPYLTWHHFDPPFRVEKHHRPEGMIALCREHADKADNGSYTDDQLRRYKAEGKGRGLSVSGRFDWMRRSILAVVGGNAFLDTDVLIQAGDRKIVWFSKNAHGELQLNFEMPTTSGRPRASIIDNCWVIEPDADCKVECPPMGRLVSVTYGNGDMFRAEFLTIRDEAELVQRVPVVRLDPEFPFEYPLTVVQLAQVASNTELQFHPNKTTTGPLSLSGGG
ncbi:hypothetical protein [Paenarthrobacter nicotinovorans]|uniref:hypothetical protein n=1 Tax=Paenarthrobacter nicotinovorans TaxID=29320 RepID=UPI0039A4F851